MLNSFLNFCSTLSIVAPCSIPFKWSKPWINKKPIKLGNFSSNFLSSFRALFRLRKISPSFFERGNESTLVGLFLPRYMLLSFFERVSPITTRDSSYEVPNTRFLISRNGKRGSLPLVVFVIEKSACPFNFFEKKVLRGLSFFSFVGIFNDFAELDLLHHIVALFDRFECSLLLYRA